MKGRKLGFLKRWVVTLGLLGGMWCALGVVSAQATPYLLDQDGCTGGRKTGSTVFGTVDVVQGIDISHVNITVTLNSPSAFVATGAGESLEFNIVGNPLITITDLTSGFVVGPAPASASTFGSFDYSVTCAGVQVGHCGPGASVKLPGPLSFTVARADNQALSPDDFVENTTYYFAADIIGPTGNTGNVAAVGGTPRVPEPSSLLLLASGLVGLGMWGHKRRRS